MDEADIQNRFQFHPATTHERREEHAFVRRSLGISAQMLNGRLPEGREKALALTRIEEAMFWANAAIARQP